MGPGSHVGFPISAKNNNLVYHHPMNISAKFGSNLFCGFRKKDENVKSFSSFFLKPQNRFESNLAEMFIGWSYTRLLFLALIGNPTWLPGHLRNIHPMFALN
jgi:hypothetical protein